MSHREWLCRGVRILAPALPWLLRACAKSPAGHGGGPRSRVLRQRLRSSRLQPIVLFICHGWSPIKSLSRLGQGTVSSHVNVRFPLRRAVMWPATRRSICYCSNRARMRFRWARLCFPCSGRRPAGDGASSRPSGCDVLVLGDPAWGSAGEIVTSQTRLASAEPWWGHLDGEGAPPWAPMALTPAWVHTGEGGMLHLASLRERPDRHPELCQ